MTTPRWPLAALVLCPVLLAGCAAQMPRGYPAAEDIGGPEVLTVVDNALVSSLGSCPSTAQDPTAQLYGLGGGGVAYRSDSSVVVIHIAEHRDAAAATDLVQAIGEVTADCDQIDRPVRLDEASAEAIAQDVEVPVSDVVAQTGNVLGGGGGGGGGDGPGTPSQDRQRAVVSVGDGRVVVVTTAVPHDEQLYHLVHITRTVVDSVRAVEGVPDMHEIRGVLDD